MSHVPNQPDDELLSAYIDGELTADELRAVEAWLESDPAARALVDELRGVSSAVKSLPRASVPPEWTAKLSERLDAAQGESKPTTHARHETNGHGDAMTSLPFGRTSRGWWWSAAAIAAAVAIMFILPRDPNEQEIASNAPLKKAPASGGELVVGAPSTEGRVADHLDAPAAAPASDSASESVDSLALNDRAEPASMAAPDSVEERGAASPVVPSTAPMLARAGRMAEARPENTYLIVWCDVPPETLRQREINNLLGSNGIAVEEETESWLAAAEPVRQQIELRNSINYRHGFAGGEGGRLGGVAEEAPAAPAVASSRFAIPDKDKDNVDRERSLPAENAQDSPEANESAQSAATLADDDAPQIEGETILVEATADQIAGCLAAMQQDPSNFHSITIEPVSEAALAEQLTGDLARRELAMENRVEEAVVPSSNAPAEPAVAEEAMDESSAMAKAVQPEPEGAAKDASLFRGNDLKQLPSLQTGVVRPQAKRLARPEEWYYYNDAPRDTQQAYQLPAPSQTTKGKPQGEYQANDNQLHLAELNRYVAEQQQQQPAGRATAAPLVEKQPVQVLFVLRNSLLPSPTAVAPAPAAEAAPAEAPPVEAGPTR